MKPFIIILICFVALTAFLSGCTSNPVDIGPYKKLQDSTYAVSDTSYLEITPHFQLGFSGPTALLSGKDQLLYVADTKNNRVVMMDIAGGYLGECHIYQPTALAQDYKLDLLVGGVDSATGAGTLYRVHLVNVLHQIDSAQITIIRKESSHPQRR
ncbi:MAG TPA: hypothetical protein VMU30_12585, partial [Bacteroidota bacterium]|nr:hypothetical protein [Bacteroidota bacterium]